MKKEKVQLEFDDLIRWMSIHFPKYESYGVFLDNGKKFITFSEN